MLHWDPDVLASLDDAVDGALAGRPTVLAIHGGPGSGRSSLLAAAVERAQSRAAERGRTLASWTAGGTAQGQRPHQGLADLGVRIVTDAEAPTSAESDRALREAIDDALDAGDLLIAIDDLQWLDPETVDALVRVLDAAVAERLLVVVTVGHLESFQHLSWQRFVAAGRGVVPIELAPLTEGTAAAIAGELRPELRAPVVQRLWRHTQGNPLFFTSLLRRAELADLERMEQLPAPEDYARAIEVRLVSLGAGAIELARAAAVIGVGWMPLAEAAYVADLDDPAAALDVLDAEFILETRMAKLGAEARIVHAVVQASIYQHIPIAERIRLHARAADVASDEQSELRHRYAATATYDAALADRLAEAAAVQSRERSHRLAATYLDWASRRTADGMLRSRRSMESYYEWVIAGRRDGTGDRLPDLRGERDRRGAALVQATLAAAANDWRVALRILEPWADDPSTDVTSYRVQVLRAWSALCSGEPTAVVLDALDRAESAERRDDALAGLHTFTEALIAGRSDQTFEVREHMARLPSRPAAVPMDDTYWLAWRGLGLGFQGRLTEAIEPLREVDARMATGFIEVGDGLTRAFLGFCYLLTGSPELGAPHLRQAEKLLQARPNPMTATIIAGGHVHRGDREHAAELLAAARSTLHDLPWPEGVVSLFGARVAWVHAFGTDADRRSLLAEHRADFGALADVPELGPLSAIWVPLAYIWAGETETAERQADRLATRTDLEWTAGVADWIRGLAAEGRGDDTAAVELLQSAARGSGGVIPSIAGHIHADLARVARRVGRDDTADDAARRAAEIYASIRAVPYLPAVEAPEVVALVPGEVPTAAPVAVSASVPGVFGMLSERERDVAALVVRGMSYAQIARELYITRSTVGFHLSRIYAKTGTGTRHELSELVRSA